MSEPNSVTAPIEKSWSELDALVGQLGDEGLMLTGADGWAVKDHLAHIAAWEASLIGLFEGTDRAAAMGIAASDDDGTDAINAAIWSLHRDKTPQKVRTDVTFAEVEHTRISSAWIGPRSNGWPATRGSTTPNMSTGSIN